MIEFLANFFSQGGTFMWLILAIMAFGVAVMIERIIFYMKAGRVNAGKMSADIARALNENNPAAAQAACKGATPIHIILSVAVEKYGSGLSAKEIKESMEEAAIKQVPRFSRRLNYLSLFANISTLSGLVGTIFGLQKSFSSLAAAEAAQKTTLLANGISEAMNTTAFGLLVAVPCMVAYTILINKQNILLENLDEASVRTLYFMEHKRS